MVTSGLVNVFTQDIQRALDFYQGVLGLHESFRTPEDGLPEHVEMTAGGFVLAISAAEAARRVHGIDAETGAAAMSLVFWVDDVDATFDAVTAAGAPALSAPHDAGNNNRNAVVRDPDGTLVELVAKRFLTRPTRRAKNVPVAPPAAGWRGVGRGHGRRWRGTRGGPGAGGSSALVPVRSRR